MDEYIRRIQLMPNSIKCSLMRPACGYTRISCDDIMGNIITRTVYRRRKASIISGTAQTHHRSEAATQRLEGIPWHKVCVNHPYHWSKTCGTVQITVDRLKIALNSSKNFTGFLRQKVI